mmetsp:Transcript_24883/g.44323  ORF Transcript_24883/g.44323 Transcript_24883/m.44323 type:complete len:341 (-) Transcript_24883:596-1618(-)
MIGEEAITFGKCPKNSTIDFYLLDSTGGGRDTRKSRPSLDTHQHIPKVMMASWTLRGPSPENSPCMEAGGRRQPAKSLPNPSRSRRAMASCRSSSAAASSSRCCSCCSAHSSGLTVLASASSRGISTAASSLLIRRQCGQQTSTLGALPDTSVVLHLRASRLPRRQWLQKAWPHTRPTGRKRAQRQMGQDTSGTSSPSGTLWACSNARSSKRRGEVRKPPTRSLAQQGATIRAALVALPVADLYAASNPRTASRLLLHHCRHTFAAACTSWACFPIINRNGRGNLEGRRGASSAATFREVVRRHFACPIMLAANSTSRAEFSNTRVTRSVSLKKSSPKRL